MKVQQDRMGRAAQDGIVIAVQPGVGSGSGCGWVVLALVYQGQRTVIFLDAHEASAVGAQLTAAAFVSTGEPCPVWSEPPSLIQRVTQ
ncbi:MAG: hypothetical protein EKK60_05940 [Gordonia sp. (in: high G+C Gram-positive bacteria)]|nr:MAG: hypothetical protein EKK60_05940 [Gordonia sp. (in: high G+C Gram-positive bacteria)]